MSGAERDDGSTGSTPGERADRLKERLYVTFAALGVVLALRSHGAGVPAREAATTLTITIGGALLAVLLADVVSHLAAHGSLPTVREARHMVAVSAGAAGVLVLPLVFLGLAARGVWDVGGALRASTIVLLVSLAVIVGFAVRRIALPVWQRVLLLAGIVAVGAGVVALELLAHGA
ncbi:hypothetical protein [Cellulomonas massiliensis]|uniref:hypothetical protein n=1 Tax=Cellulomonas massiliensis TaxID=1465811 RepID=UPI000311E434|nr:hypothetical protein [Cellulomonas massiliensis]